MTATTIGTGFRRWAGIIVAGAVLGVLAGWAVSSVTAASALTSQATVLATGELSNGQVDSALTSNQYVNQRMSTYVGIVTSDVVRTEAAQRVGVDPAELVGTIAATNPLETTLLNVSVSAATPEDAQARATAVVSAVGDQILQVENPPGTPPRVKLATVSTPSLPESTWASSVLTVFLGAVLGAALGAAVVLGMVTRARRIEERAQMFTSSFPAYPANGRGPDPYRQPGPPSPSPSPSPSPDRTMPPPSAGRP